MFKTFFAPSVKKELLSLKSPVSKLLQAKCEGNLRGPINKLESMRGTSRDHAVLENSKKKLHWGASINYVDRKIGFLDPPSPHCRQIWFFSVEAPRLKTACHASLSCFWENIIFSRHLQLTSNSSTTVKKISLWWSSPVAMKKLDDLIKCWGKSPTLKIFARMLSNLIISP